MVRCTILWLLVPLLAPLPSSPGVSIKPHPSVHRMANEAAWIVEGRVAADGSVDVDTTYFAAPSVRPVPHVAVRGLAAMSRTPSEFAVAQPKPIQPDAVLLFLVASAEGGFEPRLLLDGAARGVVWFCGDEVYGYRQCINPGPYELGRFEEFADGERHRPTPAEVRAELQLGLRSREQWRQTLAIGDPVERANAVARWFSPSTSPDAARWHERCWPDLREQAKALGAAIVLPLARLVATDADEGAVGFASSVLAELGEVARPAVPMVIARLRQPGAARAFDLVRALQAFGDARAIAVLRDQLAVADDQLAAAVGRALHRCGDAEAAARLTRRIPAAVDGDHPVAGVVELLDALHDVAPEQATALYRARFADEVEMRTARRWLRELAAAGG